MLFHSLVPAAHGGVGGEEGELLGGHRQQLPADRTFAVSLALHRELQPGWGRLCSGSQRSCAFPQEEEEVSVLLGSPVFPVQWALWPCLPPEPQELGSTGRAAGWPGQLPVLLPRGWLGVRSTRC